MLGVVVVVVEVGCMDLFDGLKIEVVDMFVVFYDLMCWVCECML